MLPVKQLRGIAIGATEPPKVNGALWLETDANGVPLQSWAWVWDGARWLSPEQQWVASFFSQSTEIAFYAGLTRKVRIKLQQADALVSVAQSSTNNWRFTLFRRDRVGNRTQITTSTTTIQSSPGWHLGRQFAVETIDIPFTSAFQRLEVLVSPTGSPGTITGSYTVIYQFER
ncbi:hypothetical protein H6F67_10145 [Microcoleus sp. FACHB-1515]|uniref:hypothetical protein n=1 Tax=Cyanophyceae TaxID=3028117 RepID=UPI0016827495|nr:hypothetical protein [Microcoleus sp. FACHB-1515]MBD2090212.1 hypothetical protein [Microcoleus sp. FACHB-1515]